MLSAQSKAFCPKRSIGGTGRDTISIYDNARAEAVLAEVDVFSAKPYQPDDPSVATPAQIAADPMQQRIDFTRISFVARDEVQDQMALSLSTASR